MCFGRLAKLAVKTCAFRLTLHSRPTAVSGSLGVVPRKRNPIIFEHVIHKGAYLER